MDETLNWTDVLYMLVKQTISIVLPAIVAPYVTKGTAYLVGNTGRWGPVISACFASVMSGVTAGLMGQSVDMSTASATLAAPAGAAVHGVLQSKPIVQSKPIEGGAMKSIALLLIVPFLMTGCYAVPRTNENTHADNKDAQNVSPSWHVEQMGPFCKMIFHEQEGGWTNSKSREDLVCDCKDLDWHKLITPVRDWKGNIVENQRLGCRNQDKTAHYTLQYSKGITEPSFAQAFVGPALQGAMGMAGSIFLGMFIKSGLENQAVSRPAPTFGQGAFDVSTFNQFSGPVQQIRPVGR